MGEIIPLCLWPCVKRRQLDFISWSPLVFSGSQVRNLLETFQCSTKSPITVIDFLPYKQWEEWLHPPISITDLDTEWAKAFCTPEKQLFSGKKNPANFLGIINPPINLVLPLLLILESSHALLLSNFRTMHIINNKGLFNFVLQLVKLFCEQLLRHQRWRSEAI